MSWNYNINHDGPQMKQNKLIEKKKKYENMF